MRNKLLLGLFIMVLVLSGCANTTKAAAESSAAETAPAVVEATAETPDASENQSTEENASDASSIIIATTTSTRDSGLLDAILPDFQAKTGIEPQVIAVGTGKALQMGVDGEADVLLVHAKSSEEAFVANGDGLERFDVMYNDFVIVGPKGDPDGLSGDNVEAALKSIYEKQLPFVSRGDDSGTHKKEKAFWESYELTPEGDWYISAGKGMGDVLQMASELQAYTMTDRATYLALRDHLELDIIVEGDSNLFNQYGVIAVNPNKSDLINAEGAQAFIDWILSDDTQALIAEYGKETFGQALFTPNAK
ncbi:substrate-binding domain-containing protein [Fusibacter paucivorans]|uniref:Substrate-binding domain-containing protein n=1 Tax=Fusibacter paucivorans TaxID=76009 RepID=A0ABS5PL51_9FIRM|nr:substrate-binding domain-containing protein [Fusibacter paucivorans]MBS7525900.1 substrate-binding domain-containing protein [Fusibacter paucivorans]